MDRVLEGSADASTLTTAQAEAITDALQEMGARIACTLLDAYEARIWLALGIPTWRQYVEERLQVSYNYAFRLLDHGRIRNAVARHEPKTPLPRSEHSTRALGTLARLDERTAALAWRTAVEANGGKPPSYKMLARVVARLTGQADPVAIACAEGMPLDATAKRRLRAGVSTLAEELERLRRAGPPPDDPRVLMANLLAAIERLSRVPRVQLGTPSMVAALAAAQRAIRGLQAV